MGDQAMGEADGDQDAPRHAGALCAFCRKPKEEAGPLCESAVEGVYICYACARLCAFLIEEENERRGLPPPTW